MIKHIHLGSLSRWIRALEQSSVPVLRDPFQREDADVLALAESSGVITSAGLATAVACEGCDAGFVGRVTRDRQRGWIRDCLCRGPRPVDPHALELVRYDREGLVMSLAAACGSARPQSPSDATCLVLGAYQRSENSRAGTIVFIEELVRADELELVRSMIQNDLKGPGIVVALSQPAASPSLPKAFRVTGMAELFYGDKGRICIDHAHAAMKLGERSTATRGRGRPSGEGAVHEAWAELCGPDQQAWSWAPKDQAQYVDEHWPNTIEPRVARSTIRKHILANAEAWRREAGPASDAVES